jgi:hypothetical protein
VAVFGNDEIGGRKVADRVTLAIRDNDVDDHRVHRRGGAAPLRPRGPGTEEFQG